MQTRLRMVLPDQELMKLYEQMFLSREFEERCAEQYAKGHITGFLHLYSGQEAVAVGATAGLHRDDYILSAYREHAQAIVRGAEPRRVMAELFGKATGVCKGKGGSMHLFDAERHFYGGNGIVGGQIPVATGVGLKIRYNKEDGVVLCFFGDGAIHQGAFHESMNMARIWNLPVIFICENNQYGMGTDWRRVSAVHDLAKMGAAYDIPGRQVNGMDALEVYDAVSEAAAAARKEGQPSFLEIRTYRYRGHSMSDPAKYRTKEELQSYKEQDPILVLKGRMEAAGRLTEAEYQAVDEACKQAADESVRFAEESPEPALESRFEDVLV